MSLGNSGQDGSTFGLHKDFCSNEFKFACCMCKNSSFAYTRSKGAAKQDLG